MSRRLSPLPLFSLLSGLLAGCQASVVWPAVKQEIRSEFPEVKQVSVDELHAWLASADPPLLLDVRQEAEFRVSHLRGAIRVDPGDGDPALPEGVGKETPIVAYCSVGYRSSALVESLTERGFHSVSNLEGSIFEWANRGFPVVREGREVRQVHPYDARWGVLLADELRAYSVD